MNTPLIIVVCVSAIMRVVGLGAESLWLDEAHTVAQLSRPWTQMFYDVSQGPAYLVLERLMVLLAGDSEAGLRLLSVLFGIAFVPLIYVLAQELFDERAAFWSSVLAGLNPLLINFSQDARPYTMFLCCGAGSVLLLLQLIRNGTRLRVIGFVASGLLALYSHAYGMFLLPVWCGIALLKLRVDRQGDRRTMQTVTLALTLIFVFYLPLLMRLLGFVGMADSDGVRGGWIAEPTVLVLGGAIYKYFLFFPLAIAICLMIVYAWWTKRSKEEKSSFWVLALLVIFSVFIPWVASRLITPGFVSRYTIQGMTGVLIAAGWSLSRLDRMTLRFAATALLILTAIPLYGYYAWVDKDPWRQTAAELRAALRPGDALVVHPDYCSEPLAYYLPDSVKMITIPADHNAQATLAGLGRVWLVSAYGTEQTRKTAEVLGALEADHRLSYSIAMDDRVRKNPWRHWMATISIRRFDRVRADEDTLQR